MLEVSSPVSFFDGGVRGRSARHSSGCSSAQCRQQQPSGQRRSSTAARRRAAAQKRGGTATRRAGARWRTTGERDARDRRQGGGAS